MVTVKKKPRKAVDLFEEAFRKNYSNSGAINAGVTHNWRPTEKEIEKYAPFNSLVIYNSNSNCTIKVKLDGSSVNYFQVPPDSSLYINPEDGIYFTWLDIENLSGSSNISADEVDWRVGASKLKVRSVPVPDA
jgi:hypothetical protein